MPISIRKIAIATCLVVCTLSSTTVLADESTTDQPTYPMFTPNNIKWNATPNMMPAGAKMAILIGNPDKKGIYVARFKLPANYELAAHFHPATEYVSVISGTLYIGQGDKLDKHASRALPAGSFVVIPKGMHLYSWTKEETVIQVGGNGPWGTKYVNKADDPRKQK